MKQRLHISLLFALLVTCSPSFATASQNADSLRADRLPWLGGEE